MNAGELSRAMAMEAESIAQHLFPRGKRRGAEWVVGSTDGEEGKSLSIRVTGAKAGVWKDFASDEGGDLLDAWVASRGLSVGDAMREAMAFLGIRENLPQKPAKAYKRPARPKCQTPKSGVKAWLNGRGLTDETIAAFKIGEQERGGKTYAIFPYLRDGELVNAKYRNVAEKHDMRQEGGAEPCLFGWHLIDPKQRTIAIAEGEIDAMTLHQVGIPALSVNAGAGNHQWIENDWDRLNRFSEIVLFFDADAAGQKGAREVARRLGEDRCKAVTLPTKDANEYLQKGADGSDFWECTRNARTFDPQELVPVADFMDQVKERFYPPAGRPHAPRLRLDYEQGWFEFRPGEFTLWTGINGHGKSLVLSQILLGLMQQGERCMIFSGEMTPAVQLERMVRQASGLERPTLGYIDAIGAWLRDRAWIFNEIGSAKIDRLLEVFGYAGKRYGVRHFVIDSLMMTDVPEDGPGAMTAQKEAVRKIVDFARSNGYHVHLVAHPRKRLDEKSAPGKMDIAGSGKITDGADNIFVIWSALQDETEAEEAGDKPNCKIELIKQRNGEHQHYTRWCWFNKAAQQFITNPKGRAYSYVPYESAPVERLGEAA